MRKENAAATAFSFVDAPRQRSTACPTKTLPAPGSWECKSAFAAFQHPCWRGGETSLFLAFVGRASESEATIGSVDIEMACIC
jgi:hypothetical protein